ncbi:MAG TPA: antibiotic biosynthesis monooxygenase [Chitinophagales bacterium]|nr:antibiotic biosynthesis monooxygenase [Chitinophagales bacterium]
MQEETVGFAVIYRWKLKPGLESQFIENWSTATQMLIKLRGALGSRLHQAEDGTWISYAQWPTKAIWEHHQSLPSINPEVSRLMTDAEEATFPPILLTPIADYLGGKPIIGSEKKK